MRSPQELLLDATSDIGLNRVGFTQERCKFCEGTGRGMDIKVAKLKKGVLSEEEMSYNDHCNHCHGMGYVWYRKEPWVAAAEGQK